MKKTAKEILKGYDLLPESGEPVNRMSLPEWQLLEAMEEYADQWRPKDQVSRQAIYEAVLSYCFVSEFDLSSSCRDRELVDARAIYSMLCRGLTSMTFQEIGQVLNRGHYTVIHYMKNLSHVPEVRKKYLEIYNILLPIK
jgi:chromosomal replication initiation ATPase DnaA